MSALIDRTVTDFLAETASSSPAPGAPIWSTPLLMAKA